MSARGWAVVGTIGLSLVSRPASGYLAGPAKSYDELAKSADVVVKGKAVADLPVNDVWFDPIPGFEARETELDVVSVIKGSPSTKRVRFRHYALAQGWFSYVPPSFTFTLQRTYLVFASDAGGGVYRQITKSPTSVHGEGVILAGDEKPHRGKTVTEAVWAELVALLASPAPDDRLAAVSELDMRSGGHRSILTDFARKPVLDLLRPSIPATTGAVQEAVIGVFGALSPYTDDDEAPFRLAEVGKGIIPGFSRPAVVKNTEADGAVQELTAAADGKGPADQRALAIRALGRTTPSHAAIARWINDPEPLVRRAAVLLAADVPDAALIGAAASDPSPIVRQGAARAIGFAQDVTLLPALGMLIRDPADKVRTAAALSLLSFSPDDAGALMKTLLASDYRALLVNALARKDPSLYLAELGEVIEKGLEPADWWGGTIPALDSWSILFAWVKKQPAADLQRKRLDRALDALEKLHWGGSSEPRDLYALYVWRGLGARAKRLRDAVKKSVRFDMDYYFDMVDKDPKTFVSP